MENVALTETQLDEVLRRCGSSNAMHSFAATHELAKALELPLRKGIMSGDILNGVYNPIDMKGGVPEFPLDFLSPGTEKDFVAYTMPQHGRVPERSVEGDYVMVTTYSIANSIDWLLRYAENARWDVVGRAMEVLEAGFVKKMNDDGWQTLLSAGADRNIVVYDGDGNTGQFTKRFVSLMKVVMRRNGGGNSTSQNRGMLTDLYVSPECIEDIRNWGIDLLDEFTRREVYLNADDNGQGGLYAMRLFGVQLHALDELGEHQEFQDFYTNQLGAAFASGKVELVVGLDRRHTDSFVMPVKKNIELFEDPLLHRQQRAGVYGWGEFGFGVLDNRRVILGNV